MVRRREVPPAALLFCRRTPHLEAPGARRRGRRPRGALRGAPVRRGAQPQRRALVAHRRRHPDVPRGGRLLREEPQQPPPRGGAPRRQDQRAGERRRDLRERRPDRIGRPSRRPRRAQRRAGRLAEGGRRGRLLLRDRHARGPRPQVARGRRRAPRLREDLPALLRGVRQTPERSGRLRLEGARPRPPSRDRPARARGGPARLDPRRDRRRLPQRPRRGRRRDQPPPRLQARAQRPGQLHEPRAVRDLGGRRPPRGAQRRRGRDDRRRDARRHRGDRRARSAGRGRACRAEHDRREPASPACAGRPPRDRQRPVLQDVARRGHEPAPREGLRQRHPPAAVVRDDATGDLPEAPDRSVEGGLRGELPRPRRRPDPRLRQRREDRDSGQAGRGPDARAPRRFTTAHGSGPDGATREGRRTGRRARAPSARRRARRPRHGFGRSPRRPRRRRRSSPPRRAP